MATRRHLSALLLACTLFFTVAAMAEAPATLRISTIGFPPYGIEEQGQFSGIYYDAANRLAQQAGYLSDNNVLPYIRIIQQMKSGQTDLTIMFRYAELDPYVEYIAALPALKTVVIGRAGIEFESIESLRGKTVANLRGATFGEALDQDELITKYPTSDFLQGLRMLLAGRVDAIAGPLAPILSAAATLGKSAEDLGPPLLISERTPWVQLSNKGRGRISADKLRLHFQALEAENMLLKLRQKYLATAGNDEQEDP